MSSQTCYIAFAYDSVTFRNLIGRGGKAIREIRGMVGGGCFIQLNSDPQGVDGNLMYVVPEDVEGGQTVRIPGPTVWKVDGGQRKCSSSLVPFRVPFVIPDHRQVRVSFVKIVASPDKVPILVKAIWQKVSLERKFATKVNVFEILDTTKEEFDELKCGAIFVGRGGSNIKKICDQFAPEGGCRAFLTREGHLIVRGGGEDLCTALLTELKNIYEKQREQTAEPDIDIFSMITQDICWDEVQ